MGQPFRLGRRPVDTFAPSSRRACFEPTVPLARILGPVFRQLLRNRGSALGAPSSGARSEEARGLSLASAVRAIPEGPDAAGLGSVLCEYANDLPGQVVSALRRTPESVAKGGRVILEPPGLLSGIVFAAVARASRGGRAN